MSRFPGWTESNKSYSQLHLAALPGGTVENGRPDNAYSAKTGYDSRITKSNSISSEIISPLPQGPKQQKIRSFENVTTCAFAASNIWNTSADSLTAKFQKAAKSPQFIVAMTPLADKLVP
jgi:hypothetical protein